MTGRWLDTLEDEARRVLPEDVFRYVQQGSGDGTTAATAAHAWAQHRLLPHVLRDVTHVDTGATLLGEATRLPYGIAPTTLQRAVHPDGEVAMARATAAAGGVLVVSSNAGTPFAAIGATGVRWWLQLYLTADRSLSVPVLERARAAGASAVVLTVDTPVVATKPVAPHTVGLGLLRVNVDADPSGEAGREKATDLGPQDVTWLGESTGLPVVVKGVLRADDATRSVDAGAAAVWVSNHGGRQLDRAVATASALAGVVMAVAARTEVYVDGGIRSGLDVATAIALGADAAFLGRLPLYALVGGEAGVARLHHDLHTELVEVLRLAGCPGVAGLRGLATAGFASAPDAT